MDEPLNLVLFSGTDDKLQAAAVLTAGAAALGQAGQHLPPVLGARRVPCRPDRPRPRAGARGRHRRSGRGRGARRRRAGVVGGHPPPGQGPRRRRHPGLLAVDGPAATRAADLDPTRRRRRRRDRLLPQRRRRPGPLHLAQPSTEGVPHMPVVEITQTVDARGLSCPMPIVKTAQAVKALAAGRSHRAARDRRRVRQGRRGLVPLDRQRARSSRHPTARSTASSSAESEAPT